MGKLKGVALAATMILLVAGTATAGVIGPQYPPPGGVSWTPVSGTSLGASGGVTWAYSGFDLTATDDLWWAPHQVGASLDGGTPDPLSYAGQTTANSVIWTGYTPIWFLSGGSVYSTTIGVQFTATLLDGATWDSTPSGASGAPPRVEDVQGNFRVNMKMEGWNNGSWIPLDSLFNYFQQAYPSHKSVTSVTAGFWYTTNPVVPLPPAALTGLVLLGALGGVGLLRRRRR